VVLDGFLPGWSPVSPHEVIRTRDLADRARAWLRQSPSVIGLQIDPDQTGVLTTSNPGR
jgi:hypothetical protein